ncbi:NAD(P)-binding protein [Rhizodiscina lignyota]|uniref:NAD(P)-binding protein n=1 Tax=Rhizodiscina lignyota TaxID=1504668 RepID=A0A9P4IB71_9PEZI|nr:NAD(P)-binding protein [Rhizodiscina lignyota]
MPSKLSFDALPDLSGKVFVVTGGNAGIGKATVVGLAAHGARVYMGARSEQKALTAINEIKNELPEVDIRYLHLDLSSLSSAGEAANAICQQESALHGLVNNAGIMGVPFSKTADGYEIQFQTNYLSHWLLTYRLLPLLQSTARTSKSGDVRIVNLTSDGHERFQQKEGINFNDIGLEGASAMARYGQSKLANILHAKELNRMYGPRAEEGDTGRIWVAAVHPGHIDTDLNRQATGTAPECVLKVMTPIMRILGILNDQEKGAWSSLWAIASAEFTEKDSGAYVVPYMKIGKPSALARDEELAKKLWAWTVDELEKKKLLD